VDVKDNDYVEDGIYSVKSTKGESVKAVISKPGGTKSAKRKPRGAPRPLGPDGQEQPYTEEEMRAINRDLNDALRRFEERRVASDEAIRRMNRASDEERDVPAPETPDWVLDQLLEDLKRQRR
jgi:hypothetical protein